MFSVLFGAGDRGRKERSDGIEIVTAEPSISSRYFAMIYIIPLKIRAVIGVCRTNVRQDTFADAKDIRSKFILNFVTTLYTNTKKSGEQIMFSALFGAGDRGRTDTVSLPQDFENFKVKIVK